MEIFVEGVESVKQEPAQTMFVVLSPQMKILLKPNVHRLVGQCGAELFQQRFQEKWIVLKTRTVVMINFAQVTHAKLNRSVS
jgi:hypothetical protein